MWPRVSCCSPQQLLSGKACHLLGDRAFWKGCSPLSSDGAVEQGWPDSSSGTFLDGTGMLLAHLNDLSVNYGHGSSCELGSCRSPSGIFRFKIYDMDMMT